MKIIISLILICFVLTHSSSAQNPYTVNGLTIDNFSKAPLTNTAVCVLNAKDSTLFKFMFTDEHGTFRIDNLKSGNFILLVSYPDYADYVEPFTLDVAHPAHNFNALNMQLKNRLLHEVVIKGSVNAIKIKGDTTEFNAKAYVNQPNDKVEDLLRQLPGIQIDKDGKISANGQAVNKVLVDGEEFFGDDPTLVTKNLRADMVDKVQLYDKKSDQAAFTGVDDGQKTKTINIKLKEDKKNGTFGKVDGGVGTQERYEGQAIYNRFQPKLKFSVYGTLANNGKTGLGGADNSKLGTTGNNLITNDDGGLSVVGGSNDALDSYNGSYNGQGKPQAYNGGFHFDNKWQTADKFTLNTNYRIGSIDVNGLTNTITQQTLVGGTINTNTNQTFDNKAFRQKLDGSFQVKLDTTATLKVGADATFKNFKVNNNYNSISENGSGSRINQDSRVVKNDGDQQVFNVTSLYTKKLKKPGRTLSWNLSEAYNDNHTKGYLNSEIDFYNPTSGIRDSLKSINQYKTLAVLSSVFTSNITYSEPFSKKISLLFNYGLAINNSSSDSRSYNPSAPNIYNLLDSVYSNSYKFNQATNQAGIIFNYKTKKVKLYFGTKASGVHYKQIDEFTGTVFERNFINWAPQASLQFSPSSQEGLYISYNGNNIQPTITQIQPIRVNTDPLNILIGNAGLRPSFSNSFNSSYMVNKVLSGINLYMYGYLFTRSNAIVTNTNISPTSGQTTTQYINLPDRTPINYSIYVAPGVKIKPIDLNAGLNFSVDGGTNYNYVNGSLSESKSISYLAAANVDKNVAQKYSLSLSGGPSYTINKFSLQPGSDNSSLGFSSSGNVTFYLPKMFIVSTDARYNYTAKTNIFDAQYRTIWNAAFSKAFFKDQNLTLSINAYNILNQDINFSRSVMANTMTQATTNSIGRYLMFSVIWNFTKFKNNSPTK